jgi:hypothetical protein
MHVADRREGGKSSSNPGGHQKSSRGVDAPEPMDLSDRPTPGSSDVDGPSDPSPAVEISDEPRENDRSDTSHSLFRDWKLSLEVTGLRLRGTTKNIVRLLGIGLVLLAAYNALLVPVYDVPSLALYRFSATPVAAGQFTYIFVEDVAAALLGAAVAWFV